MTGQWAGAKSLQRKVKGMEYTSVLQVPSSKGSKLLIKLSRREPKIAKVVGYNIKLTEKSGIYS